MQKFYTICFYEVLSHQRFPQTVRRALEQKNQQISQNFPAVCSSAGVAAGWDGFREQQIPFINSWTRWSLWVLSNSEYSVNLWQPPLLTTLTSD